MKEALRSLVLATGNTGKVRELEQLFADLPVELKSLNDFPGTSDVDETGRTFRENAELKALGFARQTGMLSLADDSGLEVEALGGAPGVYSARFAGADSGYDVKIERLLEMLDGTGDSQRRARFVCVMAIADGEGRVIHVAEGICPGNRTSSPRRRRLRLRSDIHPRRFRSYVRRTRGCGKAADQSQGQSERASNSIFTAFYCGSDLTNQFFASKIRHLKPFLS